MEPVLMGNEILTIDADTRTIDVGSDFLLGVETDNDAERVKFQCPKIVGDSLDLSQYHIYIHYQNAKGEKGKYLCEDVEDGGENITFSWLLSQKAVLYKGQTKFLVCAKKTQEDTIVWNTTLASGNVLEGLDVDEDIVQQNDDVIEQILLKLEQIEASGGTSDYNDLENKPQINGVELSGNKFGNDIGLVNNQQGTANAGKVLGIGQDGLVIPVENVGASDNIIYKDVAKQLNPNITDSFQRAMWNLKLYGQSTQGADPSPTSPQEITAISQFDGNIRNSFQLFDASELPTKSAGGATVTNNGDGSFTISGSGNLTSDITYSYMLTHDEIKKLFKEGTIYLKVEQKSNPYIFMNLYKSSKFVKTIFSTLTSNNFSVNFEKEWIDDETYTIYLGFSGSINNVIVPATIKPMLYQDGDGTWEPFDSNPQELSYTPTNPMYSTQDGSIADYVDVEKGVEVYNMSGAVVFDGNENWSMSGINYGDYVCFYLNGYIAGSLVMCNKLPYYNFKNNEVIKEAICVFNNGSLRILILKSRLTEISANGFKTWLSQNPITVIYQSAAPTEIPIPQEQLQMLRALYTYTGVTNFLCNAPVSFDYEQSLQIVIQNIWNAIGQTNANILLGGNQ